MPLNQKCQTIQLVLDQHKNQVDPMDAFQTTSQSKHENEKFNFINIILNKCVNAHPRDKQLLLLHCHCCHISQYRVSACNNLPIHHQCHGSCTFHHGVMHHACCCCVQRTMKNSFDAPPMDVHDVTFIRVCVISHQSRLPLSELEMWCCMLSKQNAIAPSS